MFSGYLLDFQKIDYQSILPSKILNFATFSLTSFLPISPQMGDRLEPLATTAAVPGGNRFTAVARGTVFLFLDSTGEFQGKILSNVDCTFSFK